MFRRLENLGRSVLEALNNSNFQKASCLYDEAGKLVGSCGGSSPGESYFQIPFFTDNRENLRKLQDFSTRGIGTRNSSEFFSALDNAKKFATLHRVERIDVFLNDEGDTYEEGQILNVW